MQAAAKKTDEIQEALAVAREKEEAWQSEREAREERAREERAREERAREERARDLAEREREAEARERERERERQLVQELAAGLREQVRVGFRVSGEGLRVRV